MKIPKIKKIKIYKILFALHISFAFIGLVFLSEEYNDYQKEIFAVWSLITAIFLILDAKENLKDAHE